jgi:phasin family protein
MTTVKAKSANDEAPVSSPAAPAAKAAKPAASAPAPASAAPAAVPPLVAPVAEAISAVQAEAVKSLGEAVVVGKETIESVVKVSTDAAAKGYDKALDLGRDQVTAAVKAHGAVYQGYEDAVAFNRDTVEALVKAGTILTKGLHDLTRSLLGLTQIAIEENVAASKALLGARTVQDLIEAQAGLTRVGLDRVAEESTRLSGDSVRLIEDAVAPINDRLNAALDRLLRAA